MAVTGLGGTTVFAQDPQLVEAEAPDYPRAAQRRQIQGYEIVKYAINSHGSVGEVEVVESVPEGIFDRSVVRALSDWVYAPSDAGFTEVERRFAFDG